MPARADRRTRLTAVAAIGVVAPVCAEYLVAYLEITGDLAESLGALMIFVPLYGGAALLIREVSVRAGMGWRGRLLLAAVFGVSMTALIDVSLWTEDRPDIDYWQDVVLAARVEPAGFGAYAGLTWVLGHVTMSVGVPLALAEAAVPGIRGRSLLGRVGIVGWSLAFLAVAVMIHVSESGTYDVHPSAGQYLGAVVVIAALAGLAWSRWGGPLPVRAGRRSPGAVVLGLVGFLGAATLDLVPAGWPGVLVIVGAAGGVAVMVGRWSRSERWGWQQVAALAWGGLLERTLVGFVAPIPDGVGVTGKVLHSVVLLVLVAGLGVLVRRRLRQEADRR